MIENESTKVIGFDLGHGEFSLAEVWMGSRNEPEIIEINNKRTQVTAVGKNNTGKIIIGENAIRQADVQSLEISFKKKPSTCNDSQKQNIHDFVAEVYKKLIENKNIEEVTKSYFFVGCPSGWQTAEKNAYQQMMTEAGLKNVSIVQESRAALMHAKERQPSDSKDANKTRIQPSDLAKSVLVIDIGSSTTDFTWVINRDDNPIDCGLNLGASLIDKEIYRRTLDTHPNKEELEQIFQEYPFFIHRCEHACRCNKEEYFRDVDGYKNNHFVNAKYERIQNKFIFDPQVNYQIIEEILNQPMKELGNKSWKSAFRDSLKEVRQKLDSIGVTPSKILLTGGASRMNFITTICDEIFPNSPWIKDTEPELTIARGLARWGRIDINTRNFKDEADKILKRDLKGIVEGNIETLINSQAQKLANGAVNHGLKPQLIQWREGKISTPEDLESKVKQEYEHWLTGTEASKIFNSELSDWLGTVCKKVEEKLSPLYDEYGLSKAGLGMTKFELKPQTRKFSSSIFTQDAITYIETYTYIEGAAAGAVVGGLAGAAVGAGGAAAYAFLAEVALAAGPVGWVALGVGALGLGIGAIVGTEEKTGTRSKDKTKVSDQDIEKKVQEQKNQLCQAMQNGFNQDQNLKQKLIEEMSQVLKDAVQTKIDKARLLIASDDG
ncbi:MAG: rod shape-determining protein [Microcoleaceae cyanobacterium MO_207.B10]|nr:rod shape-determining protein [Microcoleaceae cyanobacterium MO_207.B10]